MKNSKDYFTTGEFAKMCGVKKQTLFHYDQCGIFNPDIVGENGYRYYSYTQLETFAVISMLRDLNVHIPEIKAHMDNRAPQALIDLLESKKIEVEEKINQLQWSKKYMESKIKITKEGMRAVPGEITFQTLPDEYMITTNYRGSSDEKDVAEAVVEHFNFCHKLGLYSAYPIGGIIPRSSITQAGYTYSKFYTVVEKFELKETGYEDAILDSGGRYLVIYDNHGYENVHANCLKLIEYAKECNLVLGPFFYEDLVLDDLSTQGYYNYLVKVSIAVL